MLLTGHVKLVYKLAKTQKNRHCWWISKQTRLPSPTCILFIYWLVVLTFAPCFVRTSILAHPTCSTLLWPSTMTSRIQSSRVLIPLLEEKTYINPCKCISAYFHQTWKGGALVSWPYSARKATQLKGSGSGPATHNQALWQLAGLLVCRCNWFVLRSIDQHLC